MPRIGSLEVRMKAGLKNKYQYIILFIFFLLLLAGIFLIDYIRIIVALPFVLLLPGYLLTALLFPKADDLKKLNRIVLSMGLSILIVPWIGLLQNYLFGGIWLLPMMSAITFLDLIFIGLGWYRRKRLPEDERFRLTSKVDLLKLKEKFLLWKEKFLNKKLYYTLQIIIGLILLVTMVYILFSPKISDSFTEFYITDKDGAAAAYPEQLEVGEYGAVKAVIINHEHQKVIYTIEIKVDGDLIQTISPVSLEYLKKWEEVVLFKADKSNNAVKVEFLLFRDGQNLAPYRQLNLWVKVVPQEWR
jgi:uncharacterized membrane protein